MIEQLKPYPEYKDSGLLWLGQVPAHWDSERGKTLFTKVTRPVRIEDDVVTCFRDGIVTLRKNRRVRGFTEAIFELGYQGIRKGDLVIHAMDAFAGAIGVSDSDGKGTPVYAVCQPMSNANSHFYAYVVREMARSLWIQALSRGIRERSTDFRYETFGRQELPAPPPEEQSAIVRFLDHATYQLDKAIRAKRKIIALLNEQKQAIIHRAVTRGLDPDVPLKDSGIPWLGQMPAHWDAIRIKYVLREVDRRSETGTEPLLSLGMHRGLVIFAEYFSRPPQAATLIGFKVVTPGQLVVNRMQAGNGVIYPSHLHGLVSPDYAVFEPVGDVNLDFLGELFRSPTARVKFRAESKGLGTGTSGFLRLYNDRLGAIHVALPPRPEQDGILAGLRELLLDINQPIARIEREISLLREYRTRLIADVVTGNLDVREAAARLPEIEPACDADADEDSDDVDEPLETLAEESA